MTEYYEEIQNVQARNEQTLNSQEGMRNIENLKVNEKFNTYRDLEKRLVNYQRLSHSYFYKRDCMTIAQCRKQGVTRFINSALKYYRLKYTCINGGKNFKTKGTGERHSSTFQKKCPAYFRVSTSEDGNSLYISHLNLNHNHQTSKELFDYLPQRRRIMNHLFYSP